MMLFHIDLANKETELHTEQRTHTVDFDQSGERTFLPIFLYKLISYQCHYNMLKAQP